VAVLLAGITVVAALLRCAPLGQLLPHRLEPDPHQGTHLLARGLGLDPQQYDERTTYYPALLPALAARLPAAWTVPEPPTGAPLERQLAAAARPYLVMRWIGALLAALLPLLAYAVGRRVLGERESVLAAAFVATSSLQQMFALQARPHAAHATLAWVALWTLLRLIERPGALRAAVAAAAGALAVGSLQTGVFLLPPACVALALALRTGARGRRWAWAAPTVALLAAALLLPRPGVGAVGLELSPGGHTFEWRLFDGTGLLGLARSLGSYDPLLFVLGLAGALLASLALPRLRAWAADRRALALLGAYALPYAAVLALDGRTTDRYLLPLLPVFAWLAAHALSRACGSARERRFALASMLALVFPLAVGAKNAVLGLRADTLEQAAAWLDGHAASEGACVYVTPGLHLPRIGQREALLGRLTQGQRVQSAWLAYQERRAAQLPPATLDQRFLPREVLLAPRDEPQPILRWLARLPPTWIALEASFFTLSDASPPGLAALRDALAARAAPVAVFAGEDETWALEQSLEDRTTPWRAWRVLRARAWGPRIELYRWDPLEPAIGGAR
jgi:hypothetical protein